MLLALGFASVLYTVQLARRKQLDSLQYTTTSMEPPYVTWKPSHRYIAFLSHYKMEAASDARYMYDLMRKMTRSAVYLDSSTLSDLRQLFDEGIAFSDVVVLLCTSGVLTRPWCRSSCSKPSGAACPCARDHLGHRRPRV